MLTHVKCLYLTPAQIEFLFLHRHPTQNEFGRTGSGQSPKRVAFLSMPVKAKLS